MTATLLTVVASFSRKTASRAGASASGGGVPIGSNPLLSFFFFAALELALPGASAVGGGVPMATTAVLTGAAAGMAASARDEATNTGAGAPGKVTPELLAIGTGAGIAFAGVEAARAADAAGTADFTVAGATAGAFLNKETGWLGLGAGAGGTITLAGASACGGGVPMGSMIFGGGRGAEAAGAAVATSLSGMGADTGCFLLPPISMVMVCPCDFSVICVG